jgi:hypothetical protein
VILDPQGGEYFSLSDVGASIWELCDGSRTVEEIAASLAEIYDAPPEAIRSDVAELVDELTLAGLLVQA